MERFWIVLEGLGRCLGTLGRSWGASPAVLGSILGGLGGLLAGLGGLLGCLGGVLGGLRPAWVHFCRFKPNRVGSGAQGPPKRDPKWNQKGTQNQPKSKTKTRTKKKAFQDRLGAVLGPSWNDLGTHLGSKKCVVR